MYKRQGLCPTKENNGFEKNAVDASKTPPIRAKYIPCHIAGPTLSGREAPIYWATKVLTYPEVPIKRLIKVKLRIPVGSAAAKACGEYQDKNIRSINCCTE